MKFQYAYRDRENERHEGVIVASSRDDAFRKLRTAGMRPFFVAPAPGFVNAVLAIGKRGAAILMLGLIVLVLAVWVFRIREERIRTSTQNVFDAAISSQTRRQVVGDVAIIEKGIRTGWSDVFKFEGERFLASFAIPGVPAGERTSNEKELSAALQRHVGIEATDGIEARQIKSMVEGMKNEFRRYVKSGGTIAGYGARLVRRQEEEIGYYQRAVNFLENEIREGKPEKQLEATIDSYNQHLRSMGIRPLTMPEK